MFRLFRKMIRYISTDRKAVRKLIRAEKKKFATYLNSSVRFPRKRIRHREIKAMWILFRHRSKFNRVDLMNLDATKTLGIRKWSMSREEFWTPREAEPEDIDFSTRIFARIGSEKPESSLEPKGTYTIKDGSRYKPLNDELSKEK